MKSFRFTGGTVAGVVILLVLMLIPSGSLTTANAQNTTPGLLTNHFPLNMSQQPCLRRAEEALRAAGVGNIGRGGTLGMGGTTRYLYVLIHCVPCGNGSLVDVSVASYPGQNEGIRLRDCLSEYMMNGRSSCWGGGGSGGRGCGDLTGRWSNTTPIGSSTWDLQPLGGGRYRAVESGWGNARGTATLTGNKLRIDWVAGGVEGFYEWELDANCQQGSGRLVFTRNATGSHQSNISRIPDPNTGGGTGGSGGAGGGGGSAGGICADPQTLAIMDYWLARANPPENQYPGYALRYEEWGRKIGRSPSANITRHQPPDTRMSRCEWLWYYSEGLRSTNLGTLREYVQRRRQ